MKPRFGWAVPVLLLVLAVASGLLVPGASAAGPLPRASASPPVTGNVTGPTLLATGANATYHVNGTGGPAVLPNGTIAGNVSFYASISAGNVTGITITPASQLIINNTPATTVLLLNDVAQTVTINVMVSSTYKGANQSINFSYPIHVVTPYVVSAEIVAGSSAGVLAFPVQVALDGTVVGVVTIPALSPNQTYNLTFRYATLGLSPGDHTFSISLVSEHGLVTFANGATIYTTTFYVPSPSTDYTLWYVAGVVAFFGVLFIFATRVAARRRGALRK